MSQPILYQVLAGLIVVFFCSATYWLARTWRWHHILSLWCVMLASLPFCYYAALCMKTRVVWVREYHENLAKLEKVSEEQQLLLFGNLHEIVQTEGSIRGLRHKITRALVERGRVWRNATPSGINADGSIGLTVINAAPPAAALAPDPALVDPNAAGGGLGAPADAAGVAPGGPAAPPEPESHRIEPQSVLYAFLEGQGPQQGLPVFYLGEFRVVAATDTTINLLPILSLPAQQIPNGSWTLYESTPLDGHELFSPADFVPDDTHLFGVVDEQELRALLPKWQGQADDKYEAKIREYLRDGTPAADDDPPENVWFQVKFLRNYEMQVDADSALTLLDNRFFDNTGRATIPNLQRGEPVKFVPNDLATFNQEFAKTLIDQGICEKMRAFYVRKLNDYWFAFHHINDRLQKIAMDMESVQRNSAKLKAANDELLQQIAFREQEKKKLQDDLAKVQLEVTTLTSYHQAVDQKWRARVDLLRNLYRESHQLTEEITKASKRLSEQVNQRADQTTAMVP